MRDEPKAEGLRWLEQAQADLSWARHLQSQGAYYLVCFLAQQCAEKALKAFLYAQGEEVVVGHSVRQLCGRVAAYDEQYAVRRDPWAVLDSYYIPTRYPNGLPDDIPARVYGQEVSQGALELATAVVNAMSDWFVRQKEIGSRK